MSSAAFEVELPADESGRRAVFLSGLLLAIAGAVLVLTLPLTWPTRVAVFALWTADSIHTQSRLRQGWAACRGIRMTNRGEIRILGPGERWRAVSLATGTLITRRFAWLRYTEPGGPTRAEFLLRRSAEAAAWHRLQVIWRLSRPAFGHAGAA